MLPQLRPCARNLIQSSRAVLNQVTNDKGRWRVRDATTDDTDVVVQFNQRLAEETEDKQLDAPRLRRGVAKALADRSLCRYFLAERDGRVVGQAMITYEWSDWRDGLFWWFQSVYVDAACRRQGVFRALFRHAEQLAKATPGVCGLRLYVERNNRPAMETYRRLGMSHADYVVLETDWTNGQ
jgi:ribosomal protein S18 acetylase RimI-like enzyme